MLKSKPPESTIDPAMPDKILILGLGNLLLQDEGLGVRAVERLQAGFILPDTVKTLDGGTMGLSLLPYLKEAKCLLILDAIDTGQTPGKLIRLEGDKIPIALSLKMSMHQVGLQDLLAAGSFADALPERIVLLGIQPQSMDWGLGLTPPVEAALDPLVYAATKELRAWGIQPSPANQ